ncbi:MAG TPA: hypothetical protein VGA36_08860, partial [Nitriliruptorales bacterium]
MTEVLCRSCGRPIIGCAETAYSDGWVHASDNRERCTEGTGGLRGPHRGQFACPDYPPLARCRWCGEWLMSGSACGVC